MAGRRVDCQSVWRPWSVLCSGCCFRAWCLGAGVRALLCLHGRLSWLPSLSVVSGRCSVRRPPRCHVRHRCIGRGGVDRCHVGHLCVFPELHRRVLRRPTWGPCGGFALHGGVTRRRHAVRGLRVVQTPIAPDWRPHGAQLAPVSGWDSPGKVPPQGSSPRHLLKAPPQGSSPRRRQDHLSTNFACNSPTVRIDARLKTAEFQRSDFKT